MRIVGGAAAEWLQRVDPHFSFLEAVGFDEVTADDSSWWATWVRYTSDLSVVRVDRSIEFNRAEVHLIRLRDGLMARYPVRITSDEVSWTLLDNVVQARQPELYKSVPALKGLADKDVEHQLMFWASALKSVAPEFLEGDFSAFADADAVIRERARRRGQQVVSKDP